MTTVAQRAAKIIAENVVSALMRDQGPPLRNTAMSRDAAVTAIMVELLRIMPTEDSDRLADACNRGLDDLAILGMPNPRVEAVGSDDGSVTMREE